MYLGTSAVIHGKYGTRIPRNILVIYHYVHTLRFPHHLLSIGTGQIQPTGSLPTRELHLFLPAQDAPLLMQTGVTGKTQIRHTLLPLN